jgi:predicted phosphodiesterase
MRIAVLADIHGNLAAFEAALEHVQRQQVDQIIIAGDIVGGSPDSLDCWLLAESLRCPIIRGNHERYVAHYNTPAGNPLWHTEQFAPVRWTVSQLTDQQRQALGALPLHLHFSELPDLLVVHGSLRNDRDTVALYTPDAELATMFPDVQQTIIARAHNHICQVRHWQDRLIITAGSVGLPLDGNPTAQYLILQRRQTEWNVAHQSVPYDVDRTLRRFHETGYLEIAGPMARLFMREVATGAHHLVPFLRAYSRWQEREPLPLDAAINRFLNIW